MNDVLLTERIDDHILWITINRPKALNAINTDVMDGLQAIFVRGEFDLKDIRCIVISGAGDKAFVAGADIMEFPHYNSKQGKALSQKGHDVFNAIEHSRIPVIALVDGYTLGGGCELAMACHLRIAEEQARFGQPEINLGVVPGYGGSQRLIRYVGRSKGLEMLLTGDMVNAQEALSLGLVSGVWPTGEGRAAVSKLADKIASKSPLVVAKLIELVNTADEKSGLQLEIEHFGACFDSIDLKEGVSAFLEKRKPKFIGA